MRISHVLGCAVLLLCSCSNDDCHTQAVPAGRVCVPSDGVVASESTVALEVQELCGTGCPRPLQCTGTLRAGQVVLDLQEDVCAIQPGAEPVSPPCDPTVCQHHRVACKIPPLPPGDYGLVVGNTAGQVLHARAGGPMSCVLTTSP